MLGLPRIYWAGVIALTLFAAVLAADHALPPPVEAGHDVSTVVRDRDGQVLRAFPVADGRWRLEADLDGIDPDYWAGDAVIIEFLYFV